MLISGRNHSKIGIPFFETSVVAFLKGSVFTMVIKKVELETVCGYTSKLPDNDKPENHPDVVWAPDSSCYRWNQTERESLWEPN